MISRKLLAGMAGVAIALFPSYRARPEPDKPVAIEAFVGNWDVVYTRRGDERENKSGTIQLELSDGRIVGGLDRKEGFLELATTDQGQVEGTLWLFGVGESAIRIPVTAEMGEENQDLTLLLMSSSIETDLLPDELQEVFSEDLTIVAQRLTEGERSRRLAQQARKVRQVEARNNLGAMNRAQQAYNLEQNRLTATLGELGIGIPQETENYAYSLRLLGPTVVQHAATPKKEGLKSYTGIVYITEIASGGVTEEVTMAILCESESPQQSEPPPPRMTGGQPSCPPDFRHLGR